MIVDGLQKNKSLISDNISELCCEGTSVISVQCTVNVPNKNNKLKNVHNTNKLVEKKPANFMRFQDQSL